ncbi:putative periplasmic serine endoprotease DegP-like precursor [mine drainage metagenome]|uniref:Probable periplasmic serine endoprotease DegP-like n=1 Tax=mine drainage metagenome TaxID=410659 RepID=A0A1J5RAC1_9ZZZZ
MNSKTFSRSAVTAAILAAIVGASAHFGLPSFAQANAAVSRQAQASAMATPVTGIVDFSNIVARYGPAVVNISVTGKAQPTVLNNGVPQLDPNDPFFQFFQHFGPQFQIPQGGQVEHAEGSGFIVSSNGIILTNAHVVNGAQEVTVKLTDRREFKAKVIGTDHQTDIAVLKIKATNLPTVKIGDPNATRVGEPVLAIGSPFGFENTATAGIVSAKSRTLPDDTYVPFIQTDAAVNPGNSGGPLFNARGEVIGINSQIFTESGGYQGLSFAIPIDVATKVQAQLMQYGKVTRGRLGVTIQEVNQALADSFGLKTPHGALVSAVEKGSPAERAGLKPGDVIIALNGKAISHSSDLPAQVADIKPGTAAQVEIIRKGEKKTVTVTVGEMKPDQLASNDHGAAQQGRLGLAVRPLTREEKKQAGVTGGLLVEAVSGPAARAGIQAGDVVLSLNGMSVNSVEHLRELVAKAGKHVALLVQRDEGKIFIPVDLG